MVAIQELCGRPQEEREIAVAPPAAHKHFWPEIKGSAHFRSRRDYLAFMHHNNGKIIYLPHPCQQVPPFVLVGNWRSRSDISAVWHLKAGPEDKEQLVTGAAEICLREGAERFILRLVTPAEAETYAGLGFSLRHRIVLLEKQLHKQPAPQEPNEVRLVHCRRRDLPEVLEVDAEAFEDLWSLDQRTLESVASYCLRNVFLVAKKGDRICGYAIGGANGRIGYLQRLGVHPLFQGRGVGEALAGQLLRFLYIMGATVVSVNTQEGNLPALSLYRKLGFRDTGERRFIMERTCQDAYRGGR